MSVRDNIMDNLQSAFESILNRGDAVADGSNTGNYNNIAIVSGGIYTGSVSKTYTIEITTGGISGIAKCSITDVGGTQTITSGTALDLATDNATITFTWADATAVLVVGDKWTVDCDTYNTNIKDVFRAKAVGIVLKNYPSIVMARAGQSYERPDGIKFRNTMTVIAEAWIEERDNIDNELEKILEDMENACQLDTLRGGYAIDTIPVRSDPGLPEKGRPYGVMSLDIEITFNQVINPT